MVRGSILLPAAVAVLVVAESGRPMTSRQPDSPTPPTERRLGYSAAAFGRQRALEQRFRGAVSTDRLAAFHAAVTRQPHMSVCSPALPASRNT